MTRPESWQQSSPHSMIIWSAQLKSKDNSMLSLTASRQASTNLVNEPRPQLIRRLNSYMIDHVSGQFTNAHLISQKDRVMESLLFLTEKRDKTIKSQHCANGSTQCTYMEHDEVISLTISMEGTLLTALIKAHEG